MGLETGEWRRCRSLSFTPPASLRSHGSRPRPTRHIPPSPLAGRGVLTRLRSTPPLPPLPGGARQGGRGIPGGKDRRGERKETEGWGVTETREGREEKKKSRSGSRTHCRSVLNQLSGSLAVPCDGTGLLWWTARCSSASWRTAVAPPVEGSRQRVPRSLLLPKHGGWQQASASRRTGRLLRSFSDGRPPPRPRSTAASLPSHLFFFCSSTTASGSHWRSPPLPAARSSQHRDPTQQRGLSDSVSLLPPGLRHQCNEVRKYGKKEAGTGEHLNTFNQINKHKWNAAAPHGRLPHTKHKLKSRPGPLSSSTVVTPHLTLPKLLRGTRDRWAVQVSFITNYSTGLAPFPRLSAPPHSSHLHYLKMHNVNKSRISFFLLINIHMLTVHALLLVGLVACVVGGFGSSSDRDRGVQGSDGDCAI